ncbi:MAG: hypothetical protein Q4C30_02650 [Bacteroidia bacterium]|nr:hypothetical protein [Bacteroidia bacterium]
MNNILNKVLTICIGLLAISYTDSFSQDVYVAEVLRDAPLDTTRHGDISLSLKNISYFKNNEFFGEFADGYTLPGYRFRPTLKYQFLPNVLLEVGAEMLQYGGTDKFDKVYPYVSAIWQVNPNFSVRLGNIDGSTCHRLHQAILDPESLLSARPATGAQVLWRTSKVDGEIWIDWQSFIKHGDTIPERFMAGIRADFTPIDNNGYSLFIPLRLTFNHIGGQISTFPMPVQSLMNLQVGLKSTHKVSGSFINAIYYGVDLLYFNVFNGGDVHRTTNGYAVNPEVGMKSKLISASVGYFHADDYNSLHGMPLLTSSSRFTDAYRKARNIALAHVALEKQIHKCVRFSLDFNAYHDIDKSQFDYSYGFAIALSPNIKLANVKIAE